MKRTKVKVRDCRVVIIKGWAKGTSARAVYDPQDNCYYIIDSHAAHMVYTPDYIQEYTV